MIKRNKKRNKIRKEGKNRIISGETRLRKSEKRRKEEKDLEVSDSKNPQGKG